MSVGQLALALREALSAFDPALFSGEDCVVLAEELARTAKACETASARAAVRAADCGRVGRDASEWLSRVSGSTTGAARRALETVEALAACPETDAASRSGEVSLAQAAEIASVPECEAELLALARASGLRKVRDVARKRRLAKVDPDELHDKQRVSRELLWWNDEMGMVRFRGALPPETGTRFVKRLERETDRIWREEYRVAKAEKRDMAARAALAADALVRMLDDPGAVKSGGTDLVVAVDLRALRRGHAHEGEVCRIVGGAPLPLDVVRELAKDAFLKVVLHDGVEIHTVKHFGRHIPAVLRTALEVGAPPDFDGAQCADGCCRTFRLQRDHVDPVANGGETSIENIEYRCIPDHVKKTERDRKAGLLRGKRKARAP